MVDRSNPPKGRFGVSDAPSSDANIVGQDLVLPDGRTVGEVPAAEVRRIILGLGLVGADASMGFQDLVNIYADVVAKVRERVGTEGLQQWLLSQTC